LVKTVILIVLVVIVAAAVGWVALGFLSSSMCSRQAKIEVPSVISAPYFVDTPTRDYYARECIESGVAVIMRGYYDLRRNEWVYHNEVLALEREYYGKITVKKRVSVPAAK
jgi:hypothetical protein